MVPEELADVGLPGKDNIIDWVWWMFSFSFGACYPHFNTNKHVELAMYKKYFYTDFLENLTSRW
jgi:hypothetical protein